MKSDAITERPIVYCGELIPKVWSGAKDITRRLIRPQPPHWIAQHLRSGFREMRYLGDGHWGPIAVEKPGGAGACQSDLVIKCPYGIIGDRLWVQEAYRVIELPVPQYHQVQVEYKAGGELSGRITIPETHRRMPTATNRGKWCSGRFMPRWASRVVLDIIDMRPEFLHDVTAADALREGVEMTVHAGRIAVDISSKFSPILYPKELGIEVRHFAALWDKINHKRSPWAKNEMVWRIVTKVVKSNAPPEADQP